MYGDKKEVYTQALCSNGKMVDLGVYNFIKNAIAEGKSKDEIKATLAKGGWSDADMEEAYTAVENNTPPTIGKRTEAKREILISKADPLEIHRPTLITMLCGYFFVSTALAALSLGLLSLFGKLPLSVILTADNAPGIILSFFTIVSMIGYWRMERWGVMLYTLTTVALVLITLSHLDGLKPLEIVGLLVPTFALPFVSVYIGFAYLDQMP